MSVHPTEVERKLWLPLLVIVFALIVLLLVPVWVDQRAREMRGHSEGIIAAARAQIDAVESQIALMAASIMGYVLSADHQFLVDYRSADARQDVAFSELLTLAESLDLGVLQQVTHLRALTEQWELVAEETLRSTSPVDLYRAQLPRQQERFQQLLASIAAAEDALEREADRNAADILRIERMSTFATGALAGLVFLATLLLFSITRRFRHLARHNAQLATVAEERRELAEEAMISKAELIRGVSHDVQNPIGAASIHLDLLQSELKGALNREQQAFVASARRNLESASTILAELLDLARAEAGTLRIERTPTDIRAVVMDLLADFRGVAHAAGLTLESEIVEELPVVETDAQRVRRILENLVSNAIKYTPEGGCIRLHAEQQAAGAEGRPGVAIQVRDTGPGIPADALDRLFQEFYRVPGARRPGTGVGLAISRKLARLLGGEITLESAEGEGSAFTFWIPARQSQAT